MSYADELYLSDLRNILEHGEFEGDEGPVRARWSDGSPAPTYRLLNVCHKYNLAEEFPILTCRPVNIEKAAGEMLWIYQKKSTNIADLNSHVWDSWADPETGSVGKTYGYQAGKKYTFPEGTMDQVDRTLLLLKTNPLSRHIIINLWNCDDYMEMNLAPCCCWLQFNTVKDRLDMCLYQRSLDMISAGGWDVTAHSLLLMMIARATGYRPGFFTHHIFNMHIYDGHIGHARMLLMTHEWDRTTATYKGLSKAPIVKFTDNAPIDFYEFRPDHIRFGTPYTPARNLPRFEVPV